MTGIGVLREGPLHASVKDWCARPGDRAEVRVGRWVIDLVRADGELVEVQTGGFGPLGPKLDGLLDAHRMRIVHPVPVARRIVRVDDAGEVVRIGRSPRLPGAIAVFDKLVAFPSLLAHPHLTVEVLLCREDHVRSPAPVRARRRTRDPGVRRLTEVVDRVELRSGADALGLLPDTVRDAPFTTRELARTVGCGLVLAQRVAYCLRALEVVSVTGMRGRAPLYEAAEGFVSGRDQVARATRSQSGG
jgi:hypothetical protein